MKPQVRWTGREWALLAQYFLDHNVDPDRFGFSGALHKAQTEVLPPERHRAVKGVPAQMKKALKEHIVALEYKTAFATPYPPLDPKPPSAEGLSTEDLLVELARRIAKLLQPSVAQADVLSQLKFLEEKFKDQPVDRGFFPPPSIKLEKSRSTAQPRLLIVGPRNGQQEELRKEHPNLRLHFVTSEERPALIDAAAPCCDEVILWTNFINHQHQVHAKATGRPVVLLSGGLSTLHARLASWDRGA